jgi:hypothetical protein
MNPGQARNKHHGKAYMSHHFRELENASITSRRLPVSLKHRGATVSFAVNMLGAWKSFILAMLVSRPEQVATTFRQTPSLKDGLVKPRLCIHEE